MFNLGERIGSKIRERGYEEKILQIYVYVSVEFWELSNKDIQLCHFFLRLNKTHFNF